MLIFFPWLMDSGSACHVYLGVSQILLVSLFSSVLPSSTQQGLRIVVWEDRQGGQDSLGGRGSAWVSLGLCGLLLLVTGSCWFLFAVSPFMTPCLLGSSRLQLPPHAASKQSQAFLSPRFHPHSDLCLECSSLVWSAPQLPSVQFLSHLRDTSKCPLKPQALLSAP